MGQIEYVAEKFQKWWGRIKAGKDGFESLVGGPKGCYYHSGAFSGLVDTVIACTMSNEGVTSCHQWDKGDPIPDDDGFTVIIKNREKLLVADKGPGCFASGMPAADGTDTTRALLYFRCGSIATFVAASSDLSVIHIADYLYDLEKSGNDPLQAVLHDLLGRLTREEVTNNAGSEDGRTD